MVGTVPVGGDAPITVQTMTNTLTSDPVATINQIRRCEDAGADLIRVSCPGCGKHRRARQDREGGAHPDHRGHPFPLQARAADAGAACLRINPGNIGSSERVAEVVRAAKANGCAIRIGVNAAAWNGPARKVRRALPRSAGRIRARSHQAAAGPRFPRIQGGGEGQRRVPGGGGLHGPG
jgi:4-hydroxy-3-methylbut-2-en-1-yl diphosphate synthase IspG/GcpE